jgi:hypothetical protein
MATTNLNVHDTSDVSLNSVDISGTTVHTTNFILDEPAERKMPISREILASKQFFRKVLTATKFPYNSHAIWAIVQGSFRIEEMDDSPKFIKQALVCIQMNHHTTRENVLLHVNKIFSRFMNKDSPAYANSVIPTFGPDVMSLINPINSASDNSARPSVSTEFSIQLLNSGRPLSDILSTHQDYNPSFTYFPASVVLSSTAVDKRFTYLAYEGSPLEAPSCFVKASEHLTMLVLPMADAAYASAFDTIKKGSKNNVSTNLPRELTVNWSEQKQDPTSTLFLSRIKSSASSRPPLTSRGKASAREDGVLLLHMFPDLSGILNSGLIARLSAVLNVAGMPQHLKVLPFPSTSMRFIRWTGTDGDSGHLESTHMPTPISPGPDAISTKTDAHQIQRSAPSFRTFGTRAMGVSLFAAAAGLSWYAGLNHDTDGASAGSNSSAEPNELSDSLLRLNDEPAGTHSDVLDGFCDEPPHVNEPVFSELIWREINPDPKFNINK